jgi:multimeric flavodoxin WrbA
MKVEYYHASKYGNGAMVAEEFKKIMNAKGVEVDIHHIREAKPMELPRADIYVFSSPGRVGKPIRSMRHFLKNLRLSSGTKYAILTTQGAPRPNKKTGKMPSDEETARWQRIVPLMDELLQEKGLMKIADCVVYVTRIKGPLEEDWQSKVVTFSADLLKTA